MKKIIYFLITFSFLTLSCTRENQMFQQSFLYFDTLITIGIVDKSLSQNKFNIIMKNIKELTKKYNHIFSNYDKESDVSKIQKFQPNKFYNINPELFFVLKKSKFFFKITNGLFDVTIGKITKLYKYKKNKIPSLKNIKYNLQYVGMDKIILTNNTIKLLKENMSIDLGAIAKGYIIDKIAEYIDTQGYKNFIVNIGGDIYVRGKNKYNKNWVIGIQNPRNKYKIIKKIYLSNKAIVTSGDYERYIIRKNKRYSHILNPKTGLPIWNNVISVTVIADNATDADALATSIFLIGPQKTKDIVKKYFNDRILYYIITEEKDGFKLITTLTKEKINL